MFWRWSAAARSASTSLRASPGLSASGSTTPQTLLRTSTLGSQPIEVDATGYLSIQVNSPSNWNGSNIINGDASLTSAKTTLCFSNNQGVFPPLPVTYDLTSNTFSHVSIYGSGDNITLLINNADTAGVQSFNAGGLGDKLVTAGSTLDLSHTTVSGFTVTSTNALGTTFTVGDLGTAFQIAGGSGHDTLIAQGLTLTADQRTAIFATNSIETIIDQTGTYTVDNAPPTITSNGGGDTAAVSIVENTTAVTTVTATDPDVGQTLSYSIIGGADASKFTIGSSTGALSFVTAPNFELPTDAGGNNVYDVIVQASDGHGGIDTQAIAVGGAKCRWCQHQWYCGQRRDRHDAYRRGPAASDERGGHPQRRSRQRHVGRRSRRRQFVFDLTALTPAQPGSGIVDHILDYDQGNSGIFNPAEGDTFDFSALLSAGSGQPVGDLVRVLENPSGTAAILQIDQDGAANGAHWTTIAQLDGVHTGDGVKVIFDASQPAATLTAPALVPTHNFNGDGKADILWQNDSGLPAIWTMDGTNITGGAVLPNPGPTWHVAAAADFNGDGKSDILWQNDSGLPAIWTMDGTNITGWSRPAQSWTYVACRCGGRFQRRRQVRHSLAERQRLAGDLDHGRHQHHRLERPCPIRGLPGMSLRRPISTATASPTSFGRTTAACRRSGRWTAPTSPAGAALPNPGPTWHVAAAADFNGDGKSDILWQNDSGLPAIWTMDGTNLTAGAALPNPGPTWHVAAAADFNGDGKSDILWQNDSGLPAIWTMDGTTITGWSRPA